MLKNSMYNLQNLKTEEEAQIIVQQAHLNIMEGAFNKKQAINFLDQIYQTLQSKEATSLAKTMTMHVIKQINYSFDSKLMSVLSNHSLFDFLQREANKFDLKKRLQEKGRTKFPDSPELGVQYMRVMLQCLVYWSQKYARGSGDQPSKFKKLISSLRSKGVELPKENKYLDVARARSKKKNAQKSVSATQKTVDIETPLPNPGSSKTGKLASELAFSKNKIDLYLGTLEDEEDGQALRQQIINNHKNFVGELKKYEGHMEDVQKPENEDCLGLFFKIHHFLNGQIAHYDNYIKIDDYASYITQMKQLYEDAEFQKQQKPNGNRMEMQHIEYSPADQPRNDHPRSERIQNDDKRRKRDSGTSQNLVKNIFDRIAERSKSPHQGGGFKSINRDLEKEKQSIRKNPLRRTSRSPVTNRSISLSRSATGMGSKISPIFNNPPNKFPAPRSYDGETVPQNRELAKAIFSIKKQQGARRFKVSNFRQKNPLFENEHIQVGFKSSALYENISGFTEFICLNLFIGNKTDQVIKNFKVEYKADTNQLLYANPKFIDSLIPTGYQNKHDLMICPIKIPFSFMVMNISYSVSNSNIVTSVVLPNSILKFASYMNISKNQFQTKWQQSQQYKSLPFQLCKHFSPDSLKKWIPALQNGSDYRKFAEEGSESDYELFCEVILMQKFEGVLKVNVRPNLKVILQIGVLENDPQAIDYFRTYLETLQLIMKQMDV